MRVPAATGAAAVELSSIEGVSIHSCDGWGIYILSSQNINLKNIDVFETN